MLKKASILVLVAVMAGIFWFFDLHQYLTLEYVKASQARFSQLYAQHPIMLPAAYFLIYVLVTAFSLPGAAVLTLIGGALLGFWVALVTVSFASTIGATLACFLARFVLGSWVQEKHGGKIKTINEGVEKDGAFYLFSLRLVPLLPFFAINLLMGLTKMPLFTYYWVSQIGMLPGTAVYINAGRALGEIDSLSGILSPALIASFVLLGLFPIIVKKALYWYQGRREQKTGKKRSRHGKP